MPTIQTFHPADAPAVHALIRAIWHEFDEPGDPEAEPDLLDIPAHYLHGASHLWTAHADPSDPADPAPGHLIGTLALKDLGHGTAVLKRMYVHPGFRGHPHRTGDLLLHAALTHARAHHLHTLVLGTTPRFTRAHSFYTRHHFHRIPPETLPPNYPHDPADTLFFRRHLP